MYDTEDISEDWDYIGDIPDESDNLNSIYKDLLRSWLLESFPSNHPIFHEFQKSTYYKLDIPDINDGLQTDR